MDDICIELTENSDLDDLDFVTGEFQVWFDGEVAEPQPDSVRLDDLLPWARRNARRVVIETGMYKYSAGFEPERQTEQWRDETVTVRRYYYERPGSPRSTYWVRLIPDEAEKAALLSERASASAVVADARPALGGAAVDCLVRVVDGESVVMTAMTRIEFSLGIGTVIRQGVNDHLQINNVEFQIVEPGPR